MRGLGRDFRDAMICECGHSSASHWNREQLCVAADCECKKFKWQGPHTMDRQTEDDVPF